ncbi:cyclic nucleotide-binding domain-containing protein [Desulfopila sp. IMCC35008]|uniref:cyclic nucleotide-binding domain-containing protein n=1 Tax=Desulfopila sp. IMCC35008 TaxID=2653858 RepID=UPI0013D2CC2F|nr:cyclic nucleotide-binding domain-containing protein [Desulfopila sp. IMCC35008]
MSKISQLDSIQDVILLSDRGTPLYLSDPAGTQSNNIQVLLWHEILNELCRPKTLELIFTSGRYYLRNTELGYVIIGMNHDRNLPKIRAACDSTLHKLREPSLRKKILLKMLTDCNDQLKPNLIKELVPFADAEVAATLINLLQQERNFNPEVRAKLQLYICQALGHCQAYQAIRPLKTFLNDHESIPGAPFNVEIREAVRISIRQLQKAAPRPPTTPPPRPRPATPQPASVTPPLTNPEAPPTPQSTKRKEPTAAPKIDIPEVPKIIALVDEGKKDQAIALIMQLIEESAAQKDFTTADSLRNWLMTIDSMALIQIVRAAEIIQEEKIASINKDHLEVWKVLTEHLTEEEFSALYHAMTLKTYPAGEMLAKQGTFMAALFFINSGSVQIQAMQQNSSLPLKIKEAGEIIGAGTFFEASVWTINAKSLGTEVFQLSRNTLDNLREAHPSLESKLSHFCNNFESTSALVQKIRRNRRQLERKKLSGRLSFAVLDKAGNETGIVAKGHLLDISRGGVAFSIHSSQKKNAVNLFGRKLRVSINAGIATGLLIRAGVVRAVRDQDLIGNEYSLHLMFTTKLTGSEMQQALNANSKSV